MGLPPQVLHSIETEEQLLEQLKNIGVGDIDIPEDKATEALADTSHGIDQQELGFPGVGYVESQQDPAAGDGVTEHYFEMSETAPASMDGDGDSEDSVFNNDKISNPPTTSSETLHRRVLEGMKI